ncbi:MAG: hypothetical protein K8S99_01215 [Planctomycetes bacterium]|nr:hypothetical protein [Planctomycetota bacterium]
MPSTNKWDGLPYYDRPLGEGTGVDPRPVVMLTDFSKCTPAEAIGTGGALGKWSVIDYRTERFCGRLLHAPRNAPAPDVTLPLNVTGWHAVYVWLMGGDVDTEKQFPADFDSVYSQSPGPALALTGDGKFSGMFRTLSHDRMMWPGLEACFWRYADLTGKSMTVRHQGGTVYLGAVQLVPLSPAEVEAVERDRADKSNRRLILKGDMYSTREIEMRVEHYRHQDVAAWIAGCEESADLFAAGGSVKLKAFREACEAIDAECYVCDRPSLWSLHVHWPDARSRWFEQHPEFHCKDRDGTDTHQCSYAIPQVQEYMLERLRAAARVGIDGFGYFFNRDPGLVLFEPVAMEGFEKKHGVDPLTLDDRDERLLAWRAEIITGFMRQVRAAMDEFRTPGGGRLKSVMTVLGDPAANKFFSFDVETWVREGLVDVLLVYPWADYPDRWLAQGFVEPDVKYFTALAKGTNCKVYPMWLAGIWRTHWTPEHVRMNEYFTKAMRDYADGADGLSAWDEVGLDTAFRADRWLRLGHRERLAEWAKHDFPLPPKVRFTSLGGVTPDRYPVGSGG